MVLVDVINKLAESEMGTFLFCEQHYAALVSFYPTNLFRIRELTRDAEGECIQCTEGEATPITFDEVPESLEVRVIFTDNSDELWSASGRSGHLIYVSDNDGCIYTTMQALRRRGVEKLYIEAGYEVYTDELGESQ